MPIFMDRHDVSDEVTAENVAHLHQEDLKIQDQFGCRGLTYWFDDKRKTAFCLIEAPDIKAIHEMHDRAHGQVPNSIIEVDPGIVESFLGRIEDPERTRNDGLHIIDDPAFRTIMVVSFDQVTLVEKDSLQFKSLLKTLHSDIRNTLSTYAGNLVKQTDFHYLVSFKSVTSAAHAALDIQALSKNFSKHKLNSRMNLKIGLSTGVPVTRNQLIFEDTIKLAERMCEIVNGEIIVSPEVRDIYKSENANSFMSGKTVFSLSQADEKFITQLMDYVDAVWSNTNLQVDDFSKPVGYSKSQLYRKMIFLTGKSPNTFIKDYRLKEALKLLRKNAGNVSEIAFETGFSSPSYFSKCFQKRYGHLPSEHLQFDA